MGFLRWLSMFTLAVLLTGCPATTKVVLRNESLGKIEVLSAYSDAVLASIEPGSTETVVYNQDCFRVRKEDSVIGFRPIVPPDRYIEVRTFSVRIFGAFTKDDGLESTRLESHEGKDPNIPLARGCALNSAPT